MNKILPGNSSGCHNTFFITEKAFCCKSKALNISNDTPRSPAGLAQRHGSGEEIPQMRINPS
jgi:hypothetical protein